MFQTILFLGASICLTVVAQLLLKKGVLLLGDLSFSLSNLLNLFFQILSNFYLLSGIFSFGLAFIFWIFVLSSAQLNIVYPISTSLTLLLITIISWVLFEEQLYFLHIAGIFFIILGVFLLSSNLK